MRAVATLILTALLATAGGALAVGEPFASHGSSPATAPGNPTVRDAAARTRPATRVRKNRSPLLSPSAIAAAKPGCDRYVDAIRPYMYGAGIDDLREQVRAFRSARRQLGRDLDAAITGARDRKKVSPLVVSLRHTGLLSRALAQIDGDQVEAAFKTLSRWSKQTDREQRVAQRIGLRRCMDPNRQP